jgi:hypothetical protein
MKGLIGVEVEAEQFLLSLMVYKYIPCSGGCGI